MAETAAPVLRRSWRSPGAGFRLPAALVPAFLLAAACPAVHLPSAQAQGVEPARDLRLTLYGTEINWTPGRPGTAAAALYRQGRLLGSARVKVSEAASSVRLTLRPEAAAESAVLRPGDRLELRSGTLRQQLMVPMIAAAVDRRANSVRGRGPITGTLTLSDLSRTAAARIALVAGADGSFKWQPDAGRSIPIDAAGSLRWESPEGAIQVEQRLAAPYLNASAAGHDLTVISSTGDTVTVTILGTGDRTKTERRGEQLADGLRWSDGGDDRAWPALAPGDRIRLTAEPALLAASQTLTSTVPLMDLHLDASTRRVLGRVGAGETVSAVLDPADPKGRNRRLDLRFAEPDPGDGSRAFEADIPVDVPTVPGLSAHLYLWDTDLAFYRTTGAIPKLRLQRHLAAVSGQAQSGRPITLTWTSATGQILARSHAIPDGFGDFSANLRTAAAAPDASPENTAGFAAGQTLEVDLGDGDPRSVTLPPFFARTDPESMVLAGRTSPGAALTLLPSHEQDWFDRLPRIELEADEQGAFIVDLHDALNEPEGSAGDFGGDLILHLADWLDLIQAWGPMLIWQDLGAGWLSAVVPEPCPYSVQLLSSVTAETLATLPDPGWLEAWDSGLGILSGRFRDVLGQAVLPPPGTRIRIAACDELVEFTVPLLEVMPDPAQDRLRVQTDPGRRLQVSIGSPVAGQGFSSEVLANADGKANVDLGGYDLMANSILSVSAVTRDWYSGTVERFAPGLHVDLSEGWIQGVWDAGAQLDLRWERGAAARELGRWQATVATDGTLRTRIPRTDASNAGLEPGDRLIVSSVAGGPGAELTVPLLTLDASGPTDQPTRGQATPGQRVLLVSRHWRYDAVSQPGLPPYSVEITQADARGQWSANMRREAGDRIWASVFAAEGHEFYRAATRQLAAIQLGAAGICGMTDAPGDPVSLQLSDPEGKTLAAAKTESTSAGQYQLTPRDQSGSPLTTAAGQILSLTLASQERQISLPQWRVDVDWEGLRVHGYGPPDRTLTMRPAPAACLPADEDPWLAVATDWDAHAEAWLQLTTETSPSGWFEADLTPLFPRGRPAEVAVEAYWYENDSTRLFARLYPERLRIHSRAPELTMRGLPGMEYELALLPDDGGEQPRAAAAGTANAEGWLGLRWQDAAGKAVASRPGNRVRLSSADRGALLPDLPLPELDLDWSPGDPVRLRTTPAATLRLTLALRDAADAVLQVVADGSGRLSLGAADLPSTTRWSWQDIEGIEAALPLYGGHWLVTQAGRRPDLAPPPEREEPATSPADRRCWLPWLQAARLR
jgi:hypothetical protein